MSTLGFLWCGMVLCSPPHFHGAALSFYGEGVHGAPVYETSLSHLKSSGAQSVSFVVPWQIESASGGEISRHPDQTPDDRLLRRQIVHAHKLGFRVMLMPILLLKTAEEGEWRGRLYPSDLETFWQSYRALMRKYAALAADEGVALFSVGSELSSLEHEKGYWKLLIAEIRQIYSGELVYSANWDHFQNVSFWEDLDYVGISGYFELTSNFDASTDELVWSWEKIRWMLLDWLNLMDKPLIFTELGYPSLNGGAVKPWHYEQKTSLDLEEQRRALRAFRRVWENEQKLAGVFFWNWWGPTDGNNRWYTIPGKPAEAEVRRYFDQRRMLP